MKRAAFSVVTLLIFSFLGSAAPAQDSAPHDPLAEFVSYVSVKYRVNFASAYAMGSDVQMLLILGHALGEQAQFVHGDPARNQYLSYIRAQYENFCGFHAVVRNMADLAKLCVEAQMGLHSYNLAPSVAALGGAVPAQQTDLFTYQGWPPPGGSGTVDAGTGAAPGSGTAGSRGAPGVRGGATTTMPPSGTPVPGAATSPGSTTGATAGGGAAADSILVMTTPTSGTLYGQPICTWYTQLIITAESQNSLFGDSFNQVVVPANEVERFHIQLFHRGLNLTARLSGKAALQVLVAKGYFRREGAGGPWVSTEDYDNFVNYGRQAPPVTPSCDTGTAPVVPGGTPAGVTVIYGAVTSAGKVNDWGNRARYGVRWNIPNPTGAPITFTSGTETQWVPKNDYAGRFVEGDYETITARGFTLPAAGDTISRDIMVPCVSSTCQGTYIMELDGQDSYGNPVRLVVEFSTGG
jgi:hypothetical protein